MQIDQGHEEVAGTLKLELARYREFAAFAQFGLDLVASTQHQLWRGGFRTELRKHRHFVPMTTNLIILYLWACTRGYRDSQRKEILFFETLCLDEIQAGIKAGMDEFLCLNELGAHSA